MYSYITVYCRPQCLRAAPLVRVKQAVGKLKQELVQLEIRCGVLEHTLLVARVRDLGDLSAAADRAEASATAGL